MGLTRSGKHKRKPSGGKRAARMIKKLNSIARQPSNTRIGDKTKRKAIRVRGGSHKIRALRLREGAFTIKTHNITVKAALTQVVYHASNNELVRTNTLTKGSVVKVSVAEFAPHIDAMLEKEKDIQDIDPMFVEEYKQGNLYAIITSRPGQVGSANGHILQAGELAFYAEKFKTKQRK